MGFYDFALRFAADHCFIAFIAVWFAGQLILYPFKVVNRLIRHANLRVCGWPPAHLDADGDKIEQKEKA